MRRVLKLTYETAQSWHFQSNIYVSSMFKKVTIQSFMPFFYLFLK